MSSPPIPNFQPDCIQRDKKLCQNERIPTKVYDNSSLASIAAAQEIIDLINEKDGHVVLGLATGSTPTAVYKELIQAYKKGEVSFENVITFNLDEYYPILPTQNQSYHLFMNKVLFDHINIKKENIHIPDGSIKLNEMDKFCESYEKAIEDAGGIDLQILGIGRSGHVAFNEPGSPEDSKTRSVYLDRITRLDASDGFYGLKNVPTRAITMGVGSILSAKRILLLCFGEGKAEIIAKAIEGPRTELVAASLLQKHSNVTALLDLSAAAELTYYNMPWSLASKDSTLNITYDKQLIKKAVVWLSKTCKKPILLLTDIDYYDHHLNALLEQCGSAESVNLFVFQSIQDAISGWPAGKRKKPTTRALKVFDHPTLDKKILYDADLSYHKKVAVFSPHPDDDIISMGGTLIRLCEQGNEVHTIYQTNGSVAVWDDDVLRITELTEKFAEYFDISPAEVKEKSNKIREFFKTKSSMNGFKDDFDGINIKRMIRETEAIDASIHAGVKRENVHFLNLPFYQTGQIEKKTSNQDDIDIVKSFLNQLQPELLFAAGDLTDPHGTHRKCTRIVLSALEQLENENQTWVKNCTIYLYRGAWQEWEIERANLIVPMSPTEVNFKRLCIFKHQSQKDLALFPGSDPREFWQRAEDRNKGTAELLRNLGFASFAAAEAFVLYDKSMNI